MNRHGWTALLAAGLAGCRGTHAVARDDAATAAPPAPPSTSPRDAAPVAPVGAPADAAIPPTSITVTLTTDGHPTALRWGYAVGETDGLTVALVDHPVDCATAAKLDAREPGGAELRIDIPSGPAGTYYAGHPASAKMFVWTDQAADVPAEVAQRLGALPFELALSDASSRVTLEPVGTQAGAHVRGTVEASEATLVGTAEAHGAFDVLLCDALERQPPVLRATAPGGPARGKRGRTVLAPRSWQAILRTSPASKDEAVDLAIDRTRAGSLMEVFWIVGYPTEHVACPPPGERYSPDAHPMLAFQGIGGASREHPMTGTQQPTTFLIPTSAELDYPEAVWPAWIQLDKLTFVPGDVVHARVWAEAPPREDLPGTFGGQLDAIVCAP